LTTDVAAILVFNVEFYRFKSCNSSSDAAMCGRVHYENLFVVISTQTTSSPDMDSSASWSQQVVSHEDGSLFSHSAKRKKRKRDEAPCEDDLRQLDFGDADGAACITCGAGECCAIAAIRKTSWEFVKTSKNNNREREREGEREGGVGLDVDSAALHFIWCVLALLSVTVFALPPPPSWHEPVSVRVYRCDLKKQVSVFVGTDEEHLKKKRFMRFNFSPPPPLPLPNLSDGVSWPSPIAPIHDWSVIFLHWILLHEYSAPLLHEAHAASLSPDLSRWTPEVARAQRRGGAGATRAAASA